MLKQAELTRELETLSKLKADPYKQIWDFGYISSSDDEDEDDESSESDDDSDSSDENDGVSKGQRKKQKKEKVVQPDVVDCLIDKDK